ncbi:MAG: flagellar hook-basal body complex protein [Alphaproteobacteria bacterium]|nr:flagellar hook-basal body complex protein [Alphaproteobacteria bacterium]
MSLYGALFSGVSGLNAQSNKLGVISDNISNVNTVGYKSSNGLFGTLVTNSGATASYSPGGVIGGTAQQVSKQGNLQTTSSATDIAIQGSGFFVVNQSADGTGQVQYTRAGSFIADDLGNFKNSAGLYLQAWPLDRDGRLPGESGNLNTTSSANLSSLQTVNLQSLSGSAAATTSYSLSSNLSSSQSAFLGASGTVTMDSLDTRNKTIAADDVIAPSTPNGTVRGDRFVVSTGAGQSYTYVYGGFTYGRSVATGTGGDSVDSLMTSQTTISSDSLAIASGDVDITSGGTTVTVTKNAHGLAIGDYFTFDSSVTLDNGSGVTLTGPYKITAVTTNTFSFTQGTTALANGTSTAASQVDLQPIATVATDETAFIRHVAHGLTTGDVIKLAGMDSTIGGIDFTDFDGQDFIVTVIDDDHYSIETGVAAGTSSGGGYGQAIVSTTRSFTGNILDAQNSSDEFLSTENDMSGFSPNALSFTITTSTSGTVTFTYGTTASGTTFNTLTNLAAAIDAINGLSARIVSNQLYVSATDSNEAITFANGRVEGDDETTPGTVLKGIDWVRELGLRNVAANNSSALRFATLTGLAANVNNSPGVDARIGSAGSDATVSINVTDPLDTVTFADKGVSAATTLTSASSFETTSGSSVVVINTTPLSHGYFTGDVGVLNASAIAALTVGGIPKASLSGTFEITRISSTSFSIDLGAGNEATSTSSATTAEDMTLTLPNNTGSILAALGLVTSLDGDAYVAQTTGAIGPAYDPNDSEKNMASGSIGSHYGQPAVIYDAQGTGHDINLSFLKTDVNTWAVEIYAVPETDVDSSLPDGLITYGTLTFNGDGTLATVSSALLAEADINWTNGASPSTLTFNFGTAGQISGTPGATVIGDDDGMSQKDSGYVFNSDTQNGAPVGKLTGVSIDRSGFITASYSNGETQQLFKIPLASFTNPDALLAVSGNSFTKTNDSGEVNLKQSDSSGVGYINSSRLEASNVELADQLTDMIVAQRAYQANTKVISTADQLLDNLNQILR